MQDKLISAAQSGESCCPNLEPKTRVIGFIITAILGLLLSLTSIGTVFGLFVKAFGDSQTSWGVGFLTLGNILCIASTFFLYGPKQQCQKMLLPVRAISSIILLGTFIFSLVAAFCIAGNFMKCLAIILQFAALVWYVFSYIPFAQECLSKCTAQVCCCCCNKDAPSA